MDRCLHTTAHGNLLRCSFTVTSSKSWISTRTPWSSKSSSSHSAIYTNNGQIKASDNKSLDSPETLLANFNKLLSNIEERNIGYFYAGVKLARIEAIRASVCNHYTQTITNITSAMEERFDNLQISSIFKHLMPLLDVSTWPTDATHFGKDCIQEIAKYFHETFIYSKCRIEGMDCIKNSCQTNL